MNTRTNKHWQLINVFITIVYVDAGTGTSPIILTMVTSGIFLKRNWKIKVSQIPCDSITKG